MWKRKGHQQFTWNIFKRYDKSNVQCHYCKNIRHYAYECRKKQYDMYQQNANFIKREETESEKKENVFIIFNVQEESNKDVWYLDSGCSNHMSGNKEIFSSIDESMKFEVRMGNNNKVRVMGKGYISICTKQGEIKQIQDVYYVPSLKQQ